MSVDQITGVKRRRGTHFERLVDTFRPLSERLFDEDDQFPRNLAAKLADARIDKTVQQYLTQALAVGTFTGLVLWLLGITVGLVLFSTDIVQVETLTGLHIPNETVSTAIDVVRTPFLILSLGLVLGTLGFTAAFGGYVARPYAIADRRRREINTLLPDAVSFMYALSVGGMSQVEIIETMAEAEETYGEVSMEFRTILQETRYFDTDYRSAIRKRAAETPSKELSQFLTDMLSIIDSGGSMRDFLDDKKDIHFRTAREDQEQTLDTLELFSEVYITISLFPLLLIVILIILDMIGSGQNLLIYVTVYLLIPGLGLGFLVLVSTLMTDEPGNGYLELDESEQRFESGEGTGALDLGLITRFTGTYDIFDRIARSEGTNKAISVVKQPHIFLRDNPLYTVAITAPAAFMFLAVAVVTEAVPVSVGGVIDQPLWSTAMYVYVPLLTVCLPLAFFYEWNVRRRRAVLDGLSEHLRKLASANATGLTLLESIKVIADTTPGPVGEGFEDIYNKSHYGMHLKESLIVFNNKYRIPRLARTVKLISKAQEISSQISSVLATAAKATETQEDIERKRKRHALMQVAILILTFLTLLGVMALLKAQFVGVMAEVTQETSGGSAGTGQGFGTTMSANLISLLFFHAVTFQAIMSGLVCGYLRSTNLLAGIKYVTLLLLVSLGVWVMVS